MRARRRIVDDPECERQFLGFIGRHPRSDLETLGKAFPWSKQSISDLLNRLIRTYRVCWRMERQELRNGRRHPRRVYWLAPPDLAQRADPTAAAGRVSRAIKRSAEVTAFYFHTGTLPQDAGGIHMLAVSGQRR
jgi:hypothetical protein